MATNRIKERGRQIELTCTHPTSPSTGDPCRIGSMVGVALTDERSGGDTTVDFGPAVYDLSVKGEDDSGSAAVSAGDSLFYVDSDINDGTGTLSKKTTGYFYGFALESVGSGSTDTINVKILPNNGPGGGNILAGVIGLSELSDTPLTAATAGRAKMASGFFDSTASTAKFGADSIDNTFLLDAVENAAFAASAGTRALFANGIWTAAYLATDSVTAVKINNAELSGSELAVVADANVIGGIPVVYRIDIADLDADTDVVLTHKTTVTDVIVVKTVGAGTGTNTITVKNGSTAITDVIDLAVSDKVIVRAGSIDDAQASIAASGTLKITAVKNDDITCIVYVYGFRVA